MNCLKHTLLIIKAQVQKLGETENTEIIKTWVDLIKKVLFKLKRILENTPKDDAVEIEENQKIMDIVEKIDI